jgi:iron complex outermembrane recepter protein
MHIRFYMAASVAAMSVAGLTSAAHAQSTGSITTEEDVIVVTGTKAASGVSGVAVPDAVKPKVVLTQELISAQGSGQSILNTINQVPGVNFTNSDAYGSSGGNLRIRGFDGNRISLTFDGFPLNDTGNYAIFSNQQLDPELIYSVNVNLGTTDVDSPTASAAGGTVNYLTRKPSDEVGGLFVGSLGGDKFGRIFGMIDTGEFTKFGTKAFIAASRTRYDKFKGPGEIYKRQINAGIYQPIGDNGDFIYLKGHYNQNRNNFYRNITLTELRSISGRPEAAFVTGFTEAQQDVISGFDNLGTCTKTFPGTGAQNDNAGILPNGGANAPSIFSSGANNVLNTSSCSNFFGVRINPSNTGNLRLNSKFTITDKLTFTFDAGYQYVLANGGGSTTILESNAIVRGNSGLAGKDYNGDGDFLDTIRFYTPNTTNTRRYTVLASLIYDISDAHRIRLAYTFDRGRHRQTGQWGYLDGQGSPENVFGGLQGRPVTSADGVDLRQRDRLSIALLNQISAQYIGKFADDKLRVELGLRMPFFKRDLANYCYTQTSGSGFATCTSQIVGNVPVPNTGGQIFTVLPTAVGPYAANAVWAPFTATYKFSPVLPSAGFTFKATPDLAVFGSYAKGFSAPRTDNLYRAPIVKVDPETTDTFDLGVRYSTNRVQAQATAWMTNFKNRIVTSFDQVNSISVDRNIGTVKGKGFDVGLAIRPLDFMVFQGNISYNDSKLQDDILIGTTVVGGGLPRPLFLPTKGKQVVETPKWTLGYRTQLEFGPASVGLQVKYVSDRFATDFNDVKSPSYTTADFDARFNLEKYGAKNTWVQVNVTNLFDRFYFGNIGTQIAGPTNNGLVTIPVTDLFGGFPIPGGSAPNFSVGAPRTISATIHVGF